MVKTKIRKKGDNEDRNDLITLEDVDSQKFGRHIHDEEGQLTVDVYETTKDLVIVAPVAGVDTTNLDITVSDGEVLTIRGFRSIGKNVKDEDYLTRECFWGAFSRSIVLPDGVNVDRIGASFKRGVLKISIPKAPKEKHKKVKIQKS